MSNCFGVDYYHRQSPSVPLFIPHYLLVVNENRKSTDICSVGLWQQCSPGCFLLSVWYLWLWPMICLDLQTRSYLIGSSHSLYSTLSFVYGIVSCQELPEYHRGHTCTGAKGQNWFLEYLLLFSDCPAWSADIYCIFESTHFNFHFYFS